MFGQNPYYGEREREEGESRADEGVTPPWVWYTLFLLGVFLLVKHKVNIANEKAVSEEQTGTRPLSVPAPSSGPNSQATPIPKIKKIISV